MSVFAERLKALLIERGLTQSDLAGLIWGRVATKGSLVARGRDRVSIWCSGKGRPNRESLALLAKALGVGPGELMSEAEVRQVEVRKPSLSVTPLSDGSVFLRVEMTLPATAALEIAALILKAKPDAT